MTLSCPVIGTNFIMESRSTDVSIVCSNVKFNFVRSFNCNSSSNSRQIIASIVPTRANSRHRYGFPFQPIAEKRMFVSNTTIWRTIDPHGSNHRREFLADLPSSCPNSDRGEYTIYEVAPRRMTLGIVDDFRIQLRERLGLHVSVRAVIAELDRRLVRWLIQRWPLLIPPSIFYQIPDCDSQLGIIELRMPCTSSPTAR